VLKQLKRLLLLLIAGLFMLSETAFSQANIRDSSISMVLIQPSYALQAPGADMAKRFGINSSLGLSITYKHKSKWMFSADGAFIFSNTIGEPDLFKNILTSDGYLIGSGGFYGDIVAYERGYYLMLSLGRLFPVKKPNPNCGFFVQAGAGFMQHKIKIVDKKNTVPAVTGDYAKGYDHLSNGFATREFAGYLYTGNRRLVNFYGGLEFVQGFTAGRRSYNFDTGLPDTGKRIDLLFGLRIGWIMPLYKEAPDKYYIY
jgi:hypothetical protein